MKLKNNSNSEFSNPELSAVNYFYKIKKQKGRNKYSGFGIQSQENFNITMLHEINNTFPERLTLYPNQIDSSKTYVVIDFYLPIPAKAKLILMDSERTDAIYLLDNNLNAGKHTFVSEIRNDELTRFRYYYKLEVNGYEIVRQMKHFKKDQNSEINKLFDHQF